MVLKFLTGSVCVGIVGVYLQRRDNRVNEKMLDCQTRMETLELGKDLALRIDIAAKKVLSCEIAKDLIPSFYVQRNDGRVFKELVDLKRKDVNNSFTLGLAGPKGIGKTTLAHGSLMGEPGVIAVTAGSGSTSKSILH